MKTIADLKVGDTVWIKDEANGRHRNPEETMVVKIGTKLIEAGRMKFRKETLRANDEYGHHYLIIDRLAYEEEEARKILVSKFRYADWSKVSLEDAQWIAKIVGIV